MRKQFFKLLSVVVAIAIPFATFFTSCEKKTVDVIPDSYVINTFKMGLQNGVDSIQTVSSQHPLISKALETSFLFGNSKSGASMDNLDPNNAIYYYNDKTAVMLLSNAEGSLVAAYMYDPATNKHLDTYLAEIMPRGDANQKDTILRITSTLTGEEVLNVTHQDLNSKGWGSCMRAAIKLLYDDWDDDAAGTFACWVTGSLCAIGGAIGCGIKQL